MTDGKMNIRASVIRPPEEDSGTEGSRWRDADVSDEFKFWFEKLTFAISKQRLTLAGQEKAAPGGLYGDAGEYDWSTLRRFQYQQQRAVNHQEPSEKNPPIDSISLFRDELHLPEFFL